MRRAATLLVLTFLSGCASVDDAGTRGVGLAFETLEEGANSGTRERREVVVREEAAWQSLWREHRSIQDPGEAAPGVDFGRRMVAAVFRGDSPTGCYGAQVVQVLWDEAGRQVTVRGEWVTVVDGFCTAQVTQPFHMVELDRHDGTDGFEMRETTRTMPPE